MKALVLRDFQKSGLDAVSVQEMKVELPKAGQVLVRMKAAALNPVDLHIARGEMKMMSPVKPPFALGVDGAGVIEQLGESVQGWSVGDEVAFYTGLVHCGTVAEYMVVDANALARKPMRWSYGQAAAASLALLCANLSLTRANVKTGDRILIHGGAGSVGAAAIALANSLGAQVDATARASDSDLLTQWGVQTVIDYESQPLSTLPKQRYDMVLDSMGGDVFMQSLNLIRRGGSIASLHVMTGLEDMLMQGMKPPAIAKWLLPLMFAKYLRAAKKLGIHIKSIGTYADGATLSTLLLKAQEVGYVPCIAHTFDMADAKVAFQRLAEQKPKGKIVVEI